jgi:hypothetical protein
MGIIRWERGYAEGWDECGFLDWEDVKRFHSGYTSVFGLRVLDTHFRGSRAVRLHSMASVRFSQHQGFWVLALSGVL